MSHFNQKLGSRKFGHKKPIYQRSNLIIEHELQHYPEWSLNVVDERERQIVDFVFDEAVADVFPDMIRRSVPGYETVIPITGLLAAAHLKKMPEERRLAYDLGCSLGATTAAVHRGEYRQSRDTPPPAAKTARSSEA